MANPSLNSFTSPNFYSRETPTIPLYAAMLAGSTFKVPTFTGVNNAASNDPGGLFGWLIYSRTSLSSPIKGTTADSFIVYNNPSELVNDLNNLGSIKSCLLSNSPSEGGTFGFFLANDTQISGLTNGIDFMYALTYLAYGGTLILSGTTSGFVSYETNTTNTIDVLIGKNGSAAEVSYIQGAPNVIGIFASSNNGQGFTAINFDSLFTNPAFVSGTTYSERIFSVAGTNKRVFPTSSLKTNSEYTVSISTVSDVAGSFVRAKNNNTLYFSIAGNQNSYILNGDIPQAILYTNPIKNVYKKNRVNFYTTSANQDFLGLDLVGATAGAGITYTSSERISTSKLKQDIEVNVRNILLRFVFKTNDRNTRASITAQILNYMQTLSQYLDTGYTQVTCNDDNNTDFSATINAQVIFKPLLASDEFVINVSTLS
jgi:hypothetical protein